MPQIDCIVEDASLISAVNKAADSIFITDSDGTIRYVNPAFTAMTGYSKEEVLGQNPRLLKSGCQPAEFYGELWETIRGGNVWNGDLVNRRKDGTLFDVEMQISPIQDLRREAAGYIAIERDVTGRRAREDAKSRLLANMSCDLRTPIHGVLEMIQQLLETKLTAEQRRYASAARTRGNALLNLIDRIFALSAMELDGGDAAMEARGFSHRQTQLAEPAMEARAATAAPHSGEPCATVAEEPATESFDGEALLERLNGDRRLVSIVLRGCVYDLPAQINNLRRRLTVEDALGVQSRAYELMGSAATVAADGLCTLASEIEIAASDRRLDRCRELLHALVEEFERFKRVITQDGWL